MTLKTPQKHNPGLSVIVIVYDMPQQAMNTLFSLTSQYQRDIQSQDYEVIVVENRSRNCLNANKVTELGENFHYYLRDEPGVSPAPAINFALEHATGEMIGLIIDGARMLTPGVLGLVSDARRAYDYPMITVPGYHLGDVKHHSHNSARKQKQAEDKLLASSDWKQNGYALFDNAILSDGNRHGYFHPLMESNALFLRKQSLEKLGGIDESFDQMGGGSINLHLFRSLGLLKEHQLITLPGEGNFHQFHGGVTTSEMKGREEMLQSFTRKLDSHWDGKWNILTREPIFFGPIRTEAQGFLEQACNHGIQRFNRFKDKQRSPWADDNSLGVRHGEQY